ncbi:MAG: aromatic acid exporter family protein [Clostridiales Family XIII bacterium]|jgi:uncharacterized membrane protein YgaE (UPF0421/DUF939 family)|nr:aromatic acid exporter family protein [Clostridiales Family XIII bacterium]
MKEKGFRFGKRIVKKITGISVGMRTVKSALSVLICVVAYRLAAHLHITTNFDAFLACTAAIICMQDSVKNSLSIGAGRLQGTAIGALLGMGVLYVDLAVHNEIAHIAFVVFGTVLLILICNLLNINNAIVMGCVVFFVITLQTTDADPFLSSVRRLVDTAIGIGVSIAINHLIHNPDRNADDDTSAED